MIKNLLLLCIVFAPLITDAQELRCNVTINASAAETSDRSVFRDMKNAFEQFMNGRKWTNDAFKSHEKIACNLLITITKGTGSTGNWVASVRVQAARPVFNASYTSLVFDFADRDWTFEYIESQPLDYNDNTYSDNLTSMLAYYAYIIIGMDYDSFSELGGTPYFQKAFQVVNNAQQSTGAGWQAQGSIRNRYWLSENLMNSQMTDLRRAMYTYHRLGLDNFGTEPDKSRETILKGLKDIKKVRDINPNAILLISFFDAKGKELANIFSSGNIQVRREAYDIITSIDPSNRSNYDKIIAN
jgi:Domain of unknown function (DUF4835)